MGEAVAEVIRERGRDEAELLYGRINRIIKELDPIPGDALRDLAAIEDLRLFVSTTPDRLLTQAVNEVRYGGRPVTREVTFSPTPATHEEARNAHPPAAIDTAVLSPLVGPPPPPLRDPRGGPAGLDSSLAQRHGEPPRMDCPSTAEQADAVHWLRSFRLCVAAAPACLNGHYTALV